MMNNISDDIVKVLNNNGISVKIENIWENIGTTAQVVERVITVDFSEHDKVFEDKIAELDCMRKSWMDKAVEWQQENEQLKKRMSELESNERRKPQIAVICTEKINGQNYVRVEDFMSVVNDFVTQIEK